jgi:prephenate dehydrogenase
MQISKIAIVGCGLIGGSLGSALRASGFRGGIAGSDAPEVLEKAVRLGAIDFAAPTVESAVQDADVIVLATPISSILALLPVVAEHAPAHALITDTGSTKVEIVAKAKSVFSAPATATAAVAGDPAGASAHRRFLPGHPISGKERSGIEQADPYLFRGAKWVFTPIDAQPDPPPASPSPTSLHNGWMELIRKIGAAPVCMTPEEHDLVLAFTSHLPQLLSIALANTVLGELRLDATDGSYNRVPCGGGLRDMTRLAKSDPVVWRDIFATNGDNIRRALEEVQRQIGSLSSALSEQKLDRIQQSFRTASLISKLS